MRLLTNYVSSLFHRHRDGLSGNLPYIFLAFQNRHLVILFSKCTRSLFILLILHVCQLHWEHVFSTSQLFQSHVKVNNKIQLAFVCFGGWFFTFQICDPVDQRYF